MKPAVILPTYNEAENIKEMIERLLAADPSLTVVVVDDDSPDGTWRLAEDSGNVTGRVHVIRRTRDRGRGYAGKAGFIYCVEHEFDPIIEMDADFSHDPAYIPEFLRQSQEWDVVIGSRGVEGGGETGRGFLRRFVTAGAACYLNIMLGLNGIKDPTSGYRCFRRRVLQNVHLETLTSPGPSIVTELLFRCRRFKIREIPILFRDRTRGRSKFNFKAMRESLTLAARLRIKGR